MNAATAITLSTGMVCATVLASFCILRGGMKSLLREVLQELKVAGRTVGIQVDKHVGISVGTDAGTGSAGMDPQSGPAGG